MVTLIGRNKGLRLTWQGLERLGPRDGDFDRPILTELSQLIVESDAYEAGEIAHASGGLALADRLLDESERIIFVGHSLLRPRIKILERGTVVPFWSLVDAAAIAARLILRSLAQPVDLADQTPNVLFVTNDRQASMVNSDLHGLNPMTINLRLESMTRSRKAGLLPELRSAWVGARGLPVSARIRLTRLRFEAAELNNLVRALCEKGMTESLFGDVTGHRARLMVEFCIAAGVNTTVIQHGRVGNPCRYIPPGGVRFVARSEPDLRLLQGMSAKSVGIRWEVAAKPDQQPLRQGSDILVCPSVLGSGERFRQLRRTVEQLKSKGSSVGIRFHPDEAFQKRKARLLNVELVRSDTPLSSVHARWGRAVVPFVSTVLEDLEREGFEILEN